MPNKPTVDIAQVRRSLGNLVASVAAGEIEGVVISRYGKPMAYLGQVPADDEPPLQEVGVPVGPPPPAPAQSSRVLAREKQRRIDDLLRPKK